MMGMPDVAARTRSLVAMLFEHNDRARAAANARMAKGEKPTWQDFVDALPRSVQDELFKSVLRSRRRRFALGLNGTVWHVPRAELRDYLRQRFLPFFARNRPMPESEASIIHFRRPRLA